MLVFWHQIASPGPIRGTLGRFRFLPKIRGYIQHNVSLAVYDTQQNGDLSVFDTLPYKFCSVRYIAEWRLSGVSNTAEWDQEKLFHEEKTTLKKFVTRSL